ncbi:uncharacterized protein TrAFT101_009356 [Trichoderma asperellum]|uniref:uncharacterized protein n=1 Tax=Trichoderma asperellum TaxID=101201 RepID=UPI003324ABFC|nr:hypothetical protein TrAFT101_009356 [Trichoderma asperellum]
MGDGSAASVSAVETFTGLASNGRKGVLIRFVTMTFVKAALLMYKVPTLPPLVFLSASFSSLSSFFHGRLVRPFMLRGEKAGIAIMRKSGMSMQPDATKNK